MLYGGVGLLILIVYFALPLLFLFGVYWAVRLAIRHEARYKDPNAG